MSPLLVRWKECRKRVERGYVKYRSSVLFSDGMGEMPCLCVSCSSHAEISNARSHSGFLAQFSAWSRLPNLICKVFVWTSCWCEDKCEEQGSSFRSVLAEWRNGRHEHAASLKKSAELCKESEGWPRFYGKQLRCCSFFKGLKVEGRQEAQVPALCPANSRLLHCSLQWSSYYFLEEKENCISPRLTYWLSRTLLNLISLLT